MTRQPRVYIASKLHHAPRMLELRLAWPEIHFTARWPLMHGVVPDDERFAVQFWQDDFHDIERSDMLVVWAAPGEKLRGGLVEVGYALAKGLQVWTVGDHPDYGTWKWHRDVFRAESIERALGEIKSFALNGQF